MREIPLTQGKTALVDDEDYEGLSQFRWFAHKNGKTFYAARSMNPGIVKMHRFILGVVDPKIEVDHEDCNGLNNQRSNLRRATHGENQHNRGLYRNNPSGYKGFPGINPVLGGVLGFGWTEE